MRAGLIAFVIVVILAVVAALNSLFIINPTQQALVLQFGQVKNTIREPGLNVKVPFIQDVLILDKRNLDLNVPAQEIIAADQKRLVVDAFMRYRIRNPVEFYQTVNNVNEGAQRLSTFVQASLRAVLADATFQDIVRDNRPELMRRIAADVADRAQAIGVEVVDVKIRRADLPEANSEAIFRRMKTEREQEAREIRARGAEAARRIEAAADRTATVLRAEARRQSEQIRGEGDARKSAIFAAAYTLDPNFFDFYRSMQAYETGLRSQGTRLVLSPNAEFFRFFADPAGRPSGLIGSRQAAGGAAPDAAPAEEAPDDQAAAETGSVLTDAPSGADPEAVREEIKELSGGLTHVDPAAVGTLPATTGDVGTALQQADQAIQQAEPEQGATEAAVDISVPQPSGAASEAATPGAGEAIPQEDIPAMSEPDDSASSAGSTPTDDTTGSGTAAAGGSDASDANVTAPAGDSGGANGTVDGAGETNAQQ
ncbi:SPFH domain-containing protein [Acuticoccus sediminis]|uniref:SPFH domain-containing protein n=1 Tax=Acuticoccus sediminis TaxID=2184697 RepID=UPI001CFD9431|nr:SPFH domain-containing protein [Acuticoccus sediminis]